MTLGGPEKASDALNYRAMRFFRDLGRVKARRRLYAGANAVQLYSDVLLGRETDQLQMEETDEVVTHEELAQMDGLTDPNAPLWLAVRGRVYDVSKGTSFYAPGKNYHAFVGKDATRAFCTGCLEPACLISSTLGLSDAQVKEADRWAEYYEHHDKYTFVGKLEKPRVDIDELVEEALFAEEDGDYTAPAVPTDSSADLR